MDLLFLSSWLNLTHPLLPLFDSIAKSLPSQPDVHINLETLDISDQLIDQSRLRV